MLTKQRIKELEVYLQKRKQYSKNWRSKNKEKLKEYRKNWYSKLQKEVKEFRELKIKK